MKTPGNTIDCGNPLNRTHYLNGGLIGHFTYIPGLFAEKQPTETTLSGVLCNDLTKMPGGWSGLSNGTQLIHGTFSGNIRISDSLPRPGGLGRTFRCVAAGIQCGGCGAGTGASQYIFQTNQPFTLALWVNTGVAGTNFMSNYDIGTPASGWQFSTVSATGRLQLAIVNAAGTAGRVATGSTSIPFGSWVHVAVTYNGSNTAAGIQTYINGRQETMITIMDTDPGTIDSSFPTIALPTGNPALTGYFDDARIYDRLLSPAEIGDLFRETRSGSPTIYNRLTLEFGTVKIPFVGTATAGLTAPHPVVLAATATHTKPSFTASASLTAPHPVILTAIGYNRDIRADLVMPHPAVITASATFSKPSYTAAAILVSVNHFLSGTVKPNYYGNATLVDGHTTLIGTATHTKPVYHGTGVVSSHAVFSALGFFNPKRTGTAALLSHATISIVGVFTKPTGRGTAALVAPHPALFVGTATSTKPTYHGTAALSSHAIVTAFVGHSKPVYHGSASLASHGTIVAAATFVRPTYHGTGVLTVRAGVSISGIFSKPIFGGTAAFVLHTGIGATASFKPRGLGSGILTHTAAVLSALSTFTRPVYHGIANLASHAIAAATALLTFPGRTGTAAGSARATFTASGLFTKPVIHAVGVLSHSAATASAVGHFGKPVFAGAINATAGHPALAALATSAKPTFAGIALLVTGKHSLTATAVQTKPVVTGIGTFVVSHILLAGIVEIHEHIERDRMIISRQGRLATTTRETVLTLSREPRLAIDLEGH